MHDIDPALKREIYQTQQELIDQGWDDVALSSGILPNSLIDVTASYKRKKACFTITTAGKWKNAFKADEFTRSDLLDIAKSHLAYYKVKELVNFIDKPGSFYDVMKKQYTVGWSRIKQLVDEGLLKVYESRKLFSTPLVTPGSGFRALSPVSKHEKVIVVSFDFDTVGFRYMLADLTDAVTYVRSWAYATTVEAERDEDF